MKVLLKFIISPIFVTNTLNFNFGNILILSVFLFHFSAVPGLLQQRKVVFLPVSDTFRYVSFTLYLPIIRPILRVGKHM